MPTPISKTDLRSLAFVHGFDVARFVHADDVPQQDEKLRTWLANGYHGSMAWMQNRADERSHPKVLWHDVKSIIVLGQNYGPESDPLEGQFQFDKGVISVYAQGDDYHDVIKKRLKAFARDIVSKNKVDVKVFVDTAPVMEKPLAQQAGLGWQGKHTNLVSREFGSWLFLGSIFTTLDIESDKRELDHCGTCRACLDICPTAAFPSPYKLNAAKCISYLTIEHKGLIPWEFREAIGNRIYGCDDCLAVCPWNKFAQKGNDLKLQARDGLHLPLLANLLVLDDANFRQKFRKTAIKRIGRNHFLRNVLIAVGNSHQKDFLSQIEILLEDESEIVRGSAVWAYYKLSDKDNFQHKAAYFQTFEKSDIVKREWQECLNRISL